MAGGFVVVNVFALRGHFSLHWLLLRLQVFNSTLTYYVFREDNFWPK